MKAAVKCMGTLLLLMTVNCNSPQDEYTTLRQIMRNEDGTVYKKVYSFTIAPERERVEVYFNNGAVKEIYFRKNGRLDGIRQTFYNNGIMCEEGSWRNDLRVGEFRYYQINGQLDCVQYFGLLGDGSR